MTMTGHPTRSLLGLLIPLIVASVSSAATTLVDSSGSLTKALLPSPTAGDGIVALLSSPGTPSLFSSSTTVNFENNVISAPGASLEESSGLLARGIGAAAAASIAGAVVLTGVTLADVEVGLDGTRHGRTLAELFASALRKGKKEGVKRLMIAVQHDGEDSDSLNTEEIEEVVEEIFDSVAAAVGVDDELSDFFSIQSAFVSTPGDAAKVMSEAQSAAKNTSPPKLPTAFSDIYKQITSASDDADPTPVAEAILACNDAYSRASRSCRAKMASWKHRVSRNLLVPKFGTHADALLTRTLDLFDRDTMAAAGLPRAGELRLVIRKQLQDRTEGILKRLFDDQMAILEKNTLKRFQMTLLRKMGNGKDIDASKFYESNADALRVAAFAFQSTASSLEVPSMSLLKSKGLQEMDGKLNNALLTFPDSPAAKIKSLKRVEQAVSKKKEPTEGSVAVSLDVVAMVRPDGFGNFQGFAGYQMGPHSVTVGVHNDADDPGTIAQFGGVRPPFFRVQPKLKLDVEL